MVGLIALMRVVGGGVGRGAVLGRGRRRGLTTCVISRLTDDGFAVLVTEADRSMVIVRDCLAGDCDPTFLIFARNRGGARKGTMTHDPTFLLGVRRVPIGVAVSQGREGRPQKKVLQKNCLTFVLFSCRR